MEVKVSDCAGIVQEKAFSNAREIEFSKVKGSFHFIGLGGIGMSALARLVLARGKKVSGSDKSDSEILRELKENGAIVYVGHDAAHIEGAAIVIVSTAISPDNPELVEAKRLGLPIRHRSEMLAQLTHGRKLIGISGTHGKTTTTGMVAQVLIDGNLDPEVVVGGVFSKINANSRHGKGECFVAEIDESDGTHTKVKSHIGVITNIETDHLENYPGGLEQIVETMRVFAKQTSDTLILCMDDAGCRQLSASEEIASGEGPKLITYGMYDGDYECDYSYEVVDPFSMRVFKGEEALGLIKLRVPGTHNKSNALVACIIGLLLRIDFKTIANSLSEFEGVNRRFQILGEEAEIIVVDDYAHHPTEVIATLKAAREFVSGGKHKGKRVVSVFQPHQPTRLKNHWKAFCESFEDADLVLVTDVY
ncbi:MAG: UDP-N-acetylmuramate--L-alanine ligase, partial [Candidatus Obscuribacterales bacterium]|nr:UDP-N-acetylmuramate--L-alanine ligase [Candidatus Obscuribacterales bacterium]